MIYRNACVLNGLRYLLLMGHFIRFLSSTVIFGLAMSVGACGGGGSGNYVKLSGDYGKD